MSHRMAFKKDSCPMCRHEIGKRDEGIDEEEEEDDSNIMVFIDFFGDTHSNLGVFHLNLINELVESRINGNDEHTWNMWHGMPDYFEYKFRKKRINHFISCRVRDDKTFLIEIFSQKVPYPKYTRKTNDKWVFKSNRALKKIRSC